MKSASGLKTTLYLFLHVTVVAVLLANFASTVQADNRTPLLSFSGDSYFVDESRGQMWTKMRSRQFSSPGDVEQYISKLNEGEFNNWRLPTKKELHNLFEIFDMKKNGDVRIRIEGRYWLVDGRGEVAAGAWETGDGCGPDRVFYAGKKGHIMAVRP